MNEPTGTLFSLELPFEHVAPLVQTEGPRKLRNIFHHPSSRTPSDAANTNRSSKTTDRLAFAAPPTNPFLGSQSTQQLVHPSQPFVHRQSRAPSPESPSSPATDHRTRQSTRATPSTSPSPHLRVEMSNQYHSSRGSSSPPPSPPLESAKPIRRQSKRLQIPPTRQIQQQQQQQVWDRSDSPSPPPNKALPVPPVAAREDAFPAASGKQDNFPLPPGRLEERSSSLSGNTLLSTVQEDSHNITKPNTPLKLNVLIADDDPLSVRTIDEQLSKWGARCTTSSDGQECHDRFEMTPDNFDVILIELKVRPTS